MGIDDIISGVIGGILKPLVGGYTAHLDTTLEAFKAGSDEDRQKYVAWADYNLKMQQVKVASNQWLGPKILYMLVGAPAAIHVGAVFLDSTPFWHHAVGSWGVAKLPPEYFLFEQMIVGSLFVVSLVSAPINAVTQWFHGKQAP